MIIGGYLPCLIGIDEPCYADFNGDGLVDGGDLGLILGYWGRCPGWE